MARFRLSGIALVGGLCASCSSPSPGAGPFVPTPDADLTSQPANPDGTPYPTANLGGQPRTAARLGQTFSNLTLEGIRSAATIDTPSVVSISEYHDPAGARYDLLHVIGIFLWCPHCNNETNNLMRIAGSRADHRIAVVQVAMEGYGGGAPGGMTCRNGFAITIRTFLSWLTARAWRSASTSPWARAAQHRGQPADHGDPGGGHRRDRRRRGLRAAVPRCHVGSAGPRLA